MTNDFKREIISEIALQILPTIYGKSIDGAENSGLFQQDNWREGVVIDAFLLAEVYYNYQKEYLKE